MSIRYIFNAIFSIKYSYKCFLYLATHSEKCKARKNKNPSRRSWWIFDFAHSQKWNLNGNKKFKKLLTFYVKNTTRFTSSKNLLSMFLVEYVNMNNQKNVKLK